MKIYKSKKGRQLLLKSYDRLLEKWGIDFAESDIHTRYGRTHIFTAGDRKNPPLMLFHGRGDHSALVWIHNMSAWAKHFYVIAVDTMGGPGKSLPNTAYNHHFDQNLWIDDILDTLHLKKVHLLGMSFGGVIVQTYTAKRSQRVDKAISIAAGLLFIDHKHMLWWKYAKAIRMFLPGIALPTKKNVQRLIHKLSGTNSHVLLQDEDIMAHWQLLIKYFNNWSMRHHKMVLLNNGQINIIRDKILFIIGDKDKIVYKDETITILDKHQMDYHIVKDAGHVINHEQSEAINTLVIRYFLDN